MVKVEIEFQEEFEGTMTTFSFEQMFTSYGKPVPIWAPHLNMAPSLKQESNSDGLVAEAPITSSTVEIIPRWGIQIKSQLSVSGQDQIHLLSASNRRVKDNGQGGGPRFGKR